MLYTEKDYNFFNSFASGNIYFFSRFVYPFIFLGYFSFVQNKKEIIFSYFKILENLLIFNSVLIFLGFLFSINFFQSYENSLRFGYSGLFPRTIFNYLTFIVVSRRIFSNKIDFKLFFLILSCLLTGSKVAILFIVILSIFYFVGSKKIKWLFIALGILLLGLFFIDTIISFITKLFPFWQPILDEYGYITLLFSKRDLLLQNTLNHLMEEGTILNILFGGLNYSTYWVEMDFIDIFLFFGLVGSGMYFWLLSKIINKSNHLIPLLTTLFTGAFLFGPLLMCTYFLWVNESHSCEKTKL